MDDGMPAQRQPRAPQERRTDGSVRQRRKRAPKERAEPSVIVGLRLSERLKTILTIIGEQHRRTLQAEIRARLEASLTDEPWVIGHDKPAPPRRSVWHRIAASLKRTER